MRESAAQGSGGASKEAMLELQLKLTTAEKDLMQFSAKAEREKNEAVGAIQDDMRKKDNELRESQELVRQLKEKSAGLKKEFMDKTRAHLKQQGGEKLEYSVSSLKAQLDDSVRRYERERQSRERMDVLHKREQDLMVSAWNKLGMDYQKLVAERAIRTSGSFMTKQRQTSMSTPQK